MITVAVTTTVPTRNAFVWYPAELDFDTVEDVFRELAEKGCILLRKLECDRSPDNVFYVRERVPTILGVNHIGSIGPLNHVRIRDDATTS